MKRLSSYICGEWKQGTGGFRSLLNPTTEEVLAETSTEGLDMAAALGYARGANTALRDMGFAARAQALKTISKAIHEHREELIELAIANEGNTRGDAKFDIDGATGTISSYAYFGKELGDESFLLDGESQQLGRNPRYAGQHLMSPLTGAAVHINAYNFPAWGFAEKAAVSLLAGMPVISKPATSTALVAHRIMEIIVGADAFPKGAVNFLCGGPGDLLSGLGSQDVLAFTGSGKTAELLRRLDAVVCSSMRINVEADSLNSAIMGPDVELGSETFSLMIREVVTDATQKSGQKCTAIRRVFVPEERLDDVVEALREELSAIVTGEPTIRAVRVGPLVSKQQLEDVRSGLERVAGVAEKLLGESHPKGLHEVEDGKGFFVTPHLFKCSDPHGAASIHDHEVFGPAVTVMPYKDTADAIALCARGGGGLVSSVYTDDRKFTRAMLLGIAPHHGRLTLGSAKVVDHSMGPGTVLPNMVHGGPGRAGGGEELGGLRGMRFYLQRTAIQGYRPLLEKLFKSARI